MKLTNALVTKTSQNLDKATGQANQVKDEVSTQVLQWLNDEKSTTCVSWLVN